MQRRASLFFTGFVVSILVTLSSPVRAQEVTHLSIVANGDQLRVRWQTPDQNWYALVNEDVHLGQQIPIIWVSDGVYRGR